MTGGGWYADRAFPIGRPAAGRLLAYEHGVWRVDQVRDVPPEKWTGADRKQWRGAGMPDAATWKQRPYGLYLQHVGGVKPEGSTNDRGQAEVHVPAGSWHTWYAYRGDRWPQCSCCGEPMPCRAELEDQDVTKSLERVAALERILPGCCWACREAITSRQDSVTYEGTNLDLPGREAPTFHTRRMCRPSAWRYEERWLAEDPRRERVLTWPKCDGLLVVHADGSTECRPGRGPAGVMHESQPECRGHLTHDHGTQSACYVGDAFFAAEADMPGCPRGCDPAAHRGTGAASPRPKRRPPASQATLPEVAS